MKRNSSDTVNSKVGHVPEKKLFFTQKWKGRNSSKGKGKNPTGTGKGKGAGKDGAKSSGLANTQKI